MSRQQFRLLVVINQILLFAFYPVRAVTDRLLPPELAGQFGIDQSVMEGHAAGESLFDDPLSLLSTALNFATLASAVGLFFAKRWGRALYLACFVGTLFVTVSSPFHLDTGWATAFGALYGVTEGMILGLIYFSHLRRMFARRGEAAGDADEE